MTEENKKKSRKTKFLCEQQIFCIVLNKINCRNNKNYDEIKLFTENTNFYVKNTYFSQNDPNRLPCAKFANFLFSCTCSIFLL